MSARALTAISEDEDAAIPETNALDRRGGRGPSPRTAEECAKLVETLRKQMFEAAKDLDFEKAAKLRDEVLRLEALALEL